MKTMKQLALSLTAAVLLGTGCLKDKGYDDGEYGINDANNSPAGIGFHKGVQFRIPLGLDLTTDAQTINQQAVIMLLSSQPAANDITVNVAVDNSIVADYNTANGTSLIPMVEGTDFTLPGTTFVIPKGAKQVNVPITLPSTAGLDANSSYGLGLRIASADAGYVLSSNQNKVMFQIGLKNRWDGVYNMKGYHNRVPYTFPYEQEMDIETYGPTDDIFYWPEAGDYGHPIGVAPGQVNWYGPAIQPVMTFDPATDLITNVRNVSTTSTVPITMFTGAGSGVSRYDASTRTIYVYWNYNNNPLRAFFDTLTYIGPRN